MNDESAKTFDRAFDIYVEAREARDQALAEANDVYAKAADIFDAAGKVYNSEAKEE